MAARNARSRDELGQIVTEAVQTLGVDIAKTTHDAGEALRKTRQALNSTAQHAMEKVQDESVHAIEGLKSQVKNHPITYIAAAAGIGLVVGFLLRRG